MLTQGQAGKGNAVLNFGPGKLSMDNSQLPLQLTGEAKQADLILYARLPAQLSGSLTDPTLAFEPGALLRSKGRVIDSLDIDEIRWPLAGVKVTQRGVDGRLQAILQAHENELGDFVLHMDGLANDFLPDAGRWQWRYWGKGSFTPMNATWDVAGKGEWHDSTITLTDLSTGFDQLQYGTMTVEKPRLILDKPVVWVRDAQHPSFSGALSLDAGQTLFTGGSVLPPSTLKFSVDGRDPTYFLFKGDLHAGEIGPVRVNGRWDGIRLRGNAWWPKQSLTVFQPLVPPDWKMNLRDGELYAQVAFSAAPEQGFRAGGHGVLKGGSAWMPDNQVNGVDFVLPFRFADGAWHLGTRGPILQAHENELGDFVLHMDGLANDFLPDAGRWQWRYWGKGSFTPMNATWDVAGKGEWHDSTITLTDLSTGFDQLQYGTMTVEKPRLILDKPVVWVRDAQHPSFSGALSLDAGQTLFTGGSVLPPSTLKFSVDGRDPTYFLFKGDLHAGEIGPVRVNGRWDGIRLRGNAWWPKQSLTVFQPLVPPDWKMNLRDGELYAQVAFSAAPEQGFRAGGHGVLKGGSAWMPDNQVNGVDFVLPFRFADGAWHLGTRGPVTLRIAEVINLVTAKNITADLQGRYPWTEEEPLLLTDVSVDVLGGNVLMKQLRMPQHDPALLRLNNLSSSELVSAVNPKQFAMSGAFSGALPLWLNNEKWIVKDGWLANSGPMTLRLDKDTADAVVKDNMTAGSAINWLRYMEISRSSTNINLDNLGLLTMQANITGTSRVDGKSGTVNLNYHHEENIFTLWRSLRFGDNLQAWLEQNARLPGNDCPQGKECEEKQ